MYFFGEDKEGGPRFRELYAGGVSDHTMEMVVSILIDRGIGKIARGAAESWKGFRAARLAKQAAEKLADEALTKKADDLISGSLKRSPSYHSELGSKSKKEILDMAKQGNRRAQQMKKLIEQGDRLREKKKGK